MTPEKEVVHVLIDQETIAERVSALSAEIEADLGEHEEVLVLGVLNGSLIFIADLVRSLPMRVQYDMIRASSYIGTQPGDTLQLGAFPDPELVRDANVLLVDDILDTGRTLATIRDKLREMQPRSLRTAVLLRREGSTVEADYIGFEVGDGFVVGYGLDVDGRYRDLPYLGIYAG